jgi:hypothetical protein
MTIQAQRGPQGSLLLDLDTCGLYQIDAPALVALLRDGMQVPLYDQNRQSAPHFSGEVNAVHR